MSIEDNQISVAGNDSIGGDSNVHSCSDLSRF